MFNTGASQHEDSLYEPWLEPFCAFTGLLSQSDKGQTVLARRLGQSISKTEALLEYSWSLWLVSNKSGPRKVNSGEPGHEQPRLIDARD